MKTSETKVAKTIKKLLAQIHQVADDGNYIYRGESSEKYQKVSSTLYRELREYKAPGKFNMEMVQKVRLKIAKRYTKEESGDRILEELQHLGGSTNQIDFTTDYLIALFFACDGNPKINGKLIFLDKEKFKKEIHEPRYPQNRVIAQKSVFIRSSSGLIESDEIETITIDMKLKKTVLRYLRQHHDINAHTIYNDIHGYITRSKIHRSAHEEFYYGLMAQNEDLESAKHHYTQALEHDPIFEEAYNNRGVIYFNMGKYARAIDDLSKAIQLNPNFADAYNNRGSIHDHRGNHDSAIADYNKAIESDPKHAGAYNGRGGFYFRKGEYDLAIADLNKTIALDPNLAEAYGNRGGAKAEKHDFKEALEDFKIALQLAEQQGNKKIVANAQNAIAELLAELKK